MASPRPIRYPLIRLLLLSSLFWGLARPTLASPPPALPAALPAALLPATQPALQAPGNENWSDSLAAGPDGVVYALAPDEQGGYFVGGAFLNAGGTAASRVIHWDGVNWQALGSGVNNIVYALAYRDGQLYAAGAFSSAGGQAAANIARWDGSAWHALGAGLDNIVYTLAFDPSGQLYAAGAFTKSGTVTINRIARWDGSAWQPLGSGVAGTVRSLAFDPAGRLYVGGFFTSAGGQPANRVALWDSATWQALGSGINNSVYSILLTRSGSLLAGGNFTSAGGKTAANIAAWDGAAWSALGSGVNSVVYGLAQDSAGLVYATGGFTQAGGAAANRIARWDGSAWAALGSGLDNSGQVLNSDAQGRLLAGGHFIKAGGRASLRLAVWTAAQGLCSPQAGSSYTLYTGSLPVNLAIEQPGTLDCLAVQRFNRPHPAANTRQMTGYYWEINGVDVGGAPAADFSLSLSLPYAAADAADRLCRYSGGAWECIFGSTIPGLSVTRHQVSAFSDWVVQDDDPTATQVGALTLAAQPGLVRLEWETACEDDLIGFNLYRRAPGEAQRQRLNPAPILPQAAGSLSGAVYSYNDPLPQPGSYSYWLEVLTTQDSQWLGPYSAGQNRLFLPLVGR